MDDWLAQRAQASPQSIALIAENRQLSYAALNNLVAEMACRLNAAGIECGQHVALLMENHVEYVCLIFALARLGAVIVPLNLRLTASELHWQADNAHCAHLICSQETLAQAAALADNRRQVISIDQLQHNSIKALTDFPADDVATWQTRPLDLNAVQGIIHTSGTTGHPKGAMLTFANHLWSATSSAYRLGTLPDDRWLACMPLYHVGGLAIILRACLYGITVVLHQRFDAQAVSDALDEHQVTLLSLVPTMLRRLLDTRATRPMPPSLRCILLGGAAAPASLIEQAHARHLPIALTYGLTESASQLATATPADVLRKPGSVGKPLMFSAARIITENGYPAATGEIGEIVVSGPTVMQGYYAKPEAARQTLRDGELRTGDLGYIDDEGDLWILQRRSDLIISGGENVYPAEVEAVLLSHPGVQDACVIGIDDHQLGQRVATLVVPQQPGLTADTLLAFCRERLAGYKLPRTIHFVETLPHTASGKVDRSAAARDIVRLDSLEEFIEQIG